MSNAELSRDQIEELARSYFQDCLEVDEAQRRQAAPGAAAYTVMYDGDDPIDADREVLSSALSDVAQAIAGNDFAMVDNVATTLMTQAGVEVDRRGATYQQLASALLRAQAEMLRLADARRAGDYTVRPRDPLFAQRPAAHANLAPVKASLPLSQVAAQFVNAKERDGKWKPVTKRNSVPKLNLFVETVGDSPIDTVTRDDIRDWRDALQDLDLAPNSIRLHFKVVASMFLWAKDEGKATIDNPTRKLAPKGEQGTREVFSPADLDRLFSSPLYTGHWRPDRRERPGRFLIKDNKYWLPLIALHSAFRHARRLRSSRPRTFGRLMGSGASTCTTRRLKRATVTCRCIRGWSRLASLSTTGR